MRVVFIEEGSNGVSCSRNGMVRARKIDQSTYEAPRNELNTDVVCLTCSPDESFFVSGHKDGRLCTWDAETGKLIRVFITSHAKCQRCVSYSKL